MIRLPVFFISLFLCFSSVNADNETRDFVITGVVVNSGSAKSLSDFINYIASHSGTKLKPVFVDTYAELSARLRVNPSSLGWTCGAPYVEDHKNDGQQLISVPLFNGQPTYYSVILTQKNRPEKNLAAFKDKILVYSDPRSNSGYLAPTYHLLQKGINLKEHFKIAIHSGNHEKSLTALINGLADVAAVDEYVWVEYSKQYPEAMTQLKEIERLGPFPFTPVVAGKNVDKATLEVLQRVLTTMNQSEEGKKLLNILSIDGFVNKPNSFFQPIADMQAAVAKMAQKQ